MNENNKPIALVIKETKIKLAQVCNESKLSPVILDLIMSEIYSEVRSLAEKQTMEEEMAYMKLIQNNDVNHMLDSADD